MALPSGCIACSRKFRKMLWGLPPIHFGKEDGVERTLLRVACQSETFLASPWHGGIDIRVLWHIGCQSEFDKELLNYRLICILATSQETQFLTLSSHPVKMVSDETRHNIIR